jgi:uncharacterized protein (TIGR02246 family)
MLERWNAKDAEGYGALFTEDGSIVGFDGSSVESRASIIEHLAAIFADHDPARYVWTVREVRPLSADVVLLRAVAGMVPPGGADIAADKNAVQALVARLTADGWRIAHFHNTPAVFDGRPDEAAALTAELRAQLPS